VVPRASEMGQTEVSVRSVLQCLEKEVRILKTFV